MRTGVLLMTPKQRDRVLNRLLRHPLGRRKWNFKCPHQDHVDNFFRISSHNAQRIRNRGKTSKFRIL